MNNWNIVDSRRIRIANLSWEICILCGSRLRSLESRLEESVPNHPAPSPIYNTSKIFKRAEARGKISAAHSGLESNSQSWEMRSGIRRITGQGIAGERHKGRQVVALSPDFIR